MKSWYLIDDCTTKKAHMYDEKLPATTQDRAVELACHTWNALSDHDKKLRDAFYIGLADVDEDGCVDFSSMTDIVDIMEG